jgi:alpha,alpha-trehalase
LRVARKWNGLIDSSLAESGAIKEKYNVVTGGKVDLKTGYKSNEIGFGWTNGVYLKFQQLLAAEAK